MENALYVIESVRRFARLGLNDDAIRGGTTILKFRRLLEQRGLVVKILDAVNVHLSQQRLLLWQCKIVDATIIATPSLTKNRDKQRDPDMRQTKKRQQWYSGMKARIGVNVESGLVHTVTTTPANMGDVAEVDKLRHGREKMVYADAGYQGAKKRAPKRGRSWHIAVKRGGINAIPEGELIVAVKHAEHMKAAVHAKVEPPFQVVKRQFGYQKVRFKGLFKNTARVLTLFALSNLWMVRRALLTFAGEMRL